MKKLILITLTVLLTVGLAFAAPDNKTIISSTQLDDSPTSVTGTWNIQDYKKIAFFVDYDETEVGNAISVAVTLDVSYNGTDWIDASFYDYAGGATLQTSETISADGWYYCWFNPDMNTPYVRMVITATNTDADDLAVVIAYLVGIK